MLKQYEKKKRFLILSNSNKIPKKKIKKKINYYFTRITVFKENFLHYLSLAVRSSPK